MSIWETIGICYVVLMASLATVGFFYFAHRGLRNYQSDAVRGSELREVERIAR